MSHMGFQMLQTTPETQMCIYIDQFQVRIVGWTALRYMTNFTAIRYRTPVRRIRRRCSLVPADGILIICLILSPRSDLCTKPLVEEPHQKLLIRDSLTWPEKVKNRRTNYCISLTRIKTVVSSSTHTFFFTHTRHYQYLIPPPKSWNSLTMWSCVGPNCQTLPT